jgi:hypothetical protein
MQQLSTTPASNQARELPTSFKLRAAMLEVMMLVVLSNKKQ